MHEYVYINVKEVSFFFNSGIEVGKRYKIGYLPNTSRAIYGELLDNKQLSKVTKLKLPFKSILIYIAIWGSLFLQLY
jgi:hypothetical protein